MRIALFSFQKRRSAWADQAVEVYLQRVRRWRPVEIHQLKPTTFRGDEEEVRKDEATRLQKKLKHTDLLVALDERGDDWSTQDFANFLERAQHGGHTRLVFAVGGPYGHHASTRQQARAVVRLSSLTLNHEIARVVFAEGLYRALSVIRGDPYHHQ